MSATLHAERAAPRRRVLPLVLLWIVYWALVLAIGAGPGMAAAWRATRLPQKDAGNMSFSAGSDGFALVVKEFGRTTWEGSVGPTETLLWVVAGPLALTALWTWLGARRRRP